MSRKKLLLTLLSIVFFIAAAAGLSACFFKEPDFRCEVEKNYDGAGEVYGDYGYDYGDKVTLRQTTNLGYTFKGWHFRGELIKEDTISFVPKDYEIIDSRYGYKYYLMYAEWEKDPAIEPYEFTSTPTECKITGLKDTSLKKLTFPDYVTSIEREAFAKNSSVEEAILPSKLAVVEFAVFEECENLKSVEIPPSVKAIELRAFNMCPVLEEVRLSEGLKVIGVQAFSYCPKLERINFPEGLEAIRQSAFVRCEKLTRVVLPESLKSICLTAFEETPITEITIPASTEDVYIVEDESMNGYYVDFSCFEKYYVSPLNKHYKTDANNDFLLTADGKTLVCGGRNGNIPDGVEKIAARAFQWGKGFKNLILPSSVKEIGEYAFCGCPDLKNVSLNDELEIIENFAFISCKELVNVVNIPRNLQSIGWWVFYGCDKLHYNESGGALYLGNSSNSYKVLVKPADTDITECNVESSTQFVMGKAFQFCYKLERVTLPEGLKDIGCRAFDSCRNLKYINIPSGVEHIDPTAFEGCSAEEGYEYGNGLYFGNENDKYIVLVRAVNKDITSCEINPNVRLICTDTFAQCEKLESVTLPEGLTHIVSGMFRGCTALREISLPASLIALEDFAFAGCSSLERITFNGTTVEELGDYCLAGCAFETLIIPAGVKRAEQTVFNGCRKLKRIYYCGSYEEGKDFFYYGNLPSYFYCEYNPSYGGNGEHGGSFPAWHYENGEIVEWN